MLRVNHRIYILIIVRQWAIFDSKNKTSLFDILNEKINLDGSLIIGEVYRSVFFASGSAIMGILVSQFLARHSDKQGDRKLLILLCCLFGVLACTLFAWNRNYFILLSTGVLLSSFASTANPQMFALAREHADRTGREIKYFWWSSSRFLHSSESPGDKI